MVSRELMEGDLDLSDVGVLGILEVELKEYIGYGSLAYFCADSNGEAAPDRLGLAARA